MKKMFLIMLVLSMGFLTFSCTSTGYNTQKGAAIGTGLGALAGGIVGNAADQDVTNQKIEAAQRSKAAYAAPQGSESKNPPGEWIEVPGQWIGGKWVPAHKAWVPVNP